MPFLNSRNIPFTVFVNKEAVLENSLSYQGYNGEAIHKKFKEKTYLDSNDLRELSSYNVIIGSHSSSHKILSNFCDDLTLEKEIKENKLFLENLLSKEINHFALPYGKKEHFNQKVLDYSFSIGHKAIYTSNPTYFEIDKRVESNKIIPRIGILNDSAKDITFFVNRPIFKKINL
jgi:peptidoglycan/xylan/chitin deacetylase (PgdA/CDA1 family)